MSLADQVREAYAAGWALSGGPMTERIQAGCAAAILAALDHDNDPHVLEATLHIGKLEGTWARFFERREQVVEQGAAAVRDSWTKVTGDIDVKPVVRRLRAELALPMETDGQTQTIASAAAASLLAGVYAHDRHHEFRAVVQDALRAGMAEGKAGTLALNAEQAGYAIAETTTDQRYDWNAAYQSIYDQLENLPTLPLMAQHWIQVMLSGAARDIGILLAGLLETGASRGDMVEALEEALSAAGSTTASYRAVTLFMDQAIAQAMSQAAVDLYQSEGIGSIYFVTAGDERVCYACEQYEAGSPYTPDQVPLPAVHPRCRCVLTSDNPEPFKALAASLIDL